MVGLVICFGDLKLDQFACHFSLESSLQVKIWRLVTIDPKYPLGGATGDWMEVVVLVSFAAGLRSRHTSPAPYCTACIWLFVYSCICLLV